MAVGSSPVAFNAVDRNAGASRTGRGEGGGGRNGGISFLIKDFLRNGCRYFMTHSFRVNSFFALHMVQQIEVWWYYRDHVRGKRRILCI